PVAGLPHTRGDGQQTPSMQGWSSGQVQSRVPPQPSGKVPQTPGGQVLGTQRQMPSTQTEFGGQQIFWPAALVQIRVVGQQLPFMQSWTGGPQTFLSWWESVSPQTRPGGQQRPSIHGWPGGQQIFGVPFRPPQIRPCGQQAPFTQSWPGGQQTFL